ncbi:MAG: GtrA family protein [Opitutaceae bacterium]
MNAKNKKFINSFFKYGINSASVLAIKLSITWILLQLLLSPFIAYAIVHVVIFFVSYFIHTKWSFNVQRSKKSITRYFQAVIIFKIIDYLTFSILFSLLNIDALIAVILATLTIACFRFLTLNKMLR